MPDGDVRPQSGFDDVLGQYGLGPLTRAPLQELQINVGKRCNQACNHCHVDAGPKRTEIMSWQTMDKIITWADQAAIGKVDITGGAPELNPHYRDLVDAFIAKHVAITARCNLTVIFEPDQEDLPQWYAERQVRLVCSLPCYTEDTVDAQRGKGVFDKSIRALRALNAQGYGIDPELKLDLVYNPGGAFLPPAQAQLEADYHKFLFNDFGIRFHKLLTLTNLPISRFAHYLKQTGQEDDYRQLLLESFNPCTVSGLMCRHLISVDWTGRVYDCDFNQMLELPMPGGQRYLWELDPKQLAGAPIRVARHCFGCTAGAGSSCGGALVLSPPNDARRAGASLYS